MNVSRSRIQFRGTAATAYASFVLLTASALAQIQWQSIPVGAGGPSHRTAATMEFVPFTGGTVLYGGWHPTQFALAEMWRWDGSTWTLIDAAPAPGGLFDHAMSLGANDRLLLFGGARGNLLGETWEWDAITATWTQRFPAHAPSPRAHHRMVFDEARGVHVLFGGGDAIGANDETWEWNGTDWTQRMFAVKPLARVDSAMAYDRARQRLVLFGGQAGAGGTTLGDTWEYDGSAWTQRTPVHSPSPRATQSMTFDAARAVVVMYGGQFAPWTPSPLFLAETWEWNGTEWAQRATVATPDGVAQAAMAYDYARARVVLFGGADAQGLGQGTWLCAPLNPASAFARGSGCSGSNGVPSLGPAPYSLPWLGDHFRSRVSGVPAGSGAFLVAGASATPPVSLAYLGLVGCNSFITAEIAVFGLGNGGIAEWGLTLPSGPGLLGVQIHQQVLVLDALAPGGAVVSNALQLTAGAR